jgi:hypothetical protein
MLQSSYTSCFAAHGDPLACDEPSDCGPGQYCVVGSNAPMTVHCSNTATGAQLCKVDADCAPGVSCITNTCFTGYSIQTVKTCGPDPWCTQP